MPPARRIPSSSLGARLPRAVGEVGRDVLGAIHEVVAGQQVSVGGDHVAAPRRVSAGLRHRQVDEGAGTSLIARVSTTPVYADATILA